MRAATTTAWRFRRDVRLGERNEAAILDRIRAAFGDPTLSKDPNPYAPFDFVNAARDLYVELKCLSTPKDRYPSQMLPLSKIRFALKRSSENPAAQFFVVNRFGDGAVECAHWTPDLQLEVKGGGRWDRGVDERALYSYIPNEAFVPLPEANTAPSVYTSCDPAAPARAANDPIHAY